MRYYIAIDDTDNAAGAGQNQGTGARARQLATLLAQATGGRPGGVTRHQLLVDPAIPYTSHNSAACIVINVVEEQNPSDVLARLTAEGAVFLEQYSAPGSDAGLCVATWPQVPAAVLDWGRRAQRELLTAAEAHQIAADTGIHLSGHTGDRIGVIGALAAVGLRHGGADGRFVHLPGLRQLLGPQPVSALTAVGVAGFRTVTVPVGLSAGEVIDIGDKWPQPVLLDDRPILLIEPTGQDAVAWRTVPREILKQY
jgi:hypothetical protein